MLRAETDASYKPEYNIKRAEFAFMLNKQGPELEHSTYLKISRQKRKMNKKPTTSYSRGLYSITATMATHV